MHILFLLCFVAIAACNQPTSKIPQHDFTVRKIPSPFDTTVYSIADYKGFIFCQQANGIVAVLDTAYARQSGIEELVNTKEISGLFTTGDTLFLRTDKELYYLSDSFTLKKYPVQEKTFYFYEDSAFAVKDCCMGEFGGTVFFQEKTTGKIYSYPATCAVQLMLTRSGYFVVQNLAHMGYSTGYVSIPDPRNLYELPAHSTTNECGWWTHDTMYTFTAKSDARHVIHHRPAVDNSMTVVSFLRDDSLYAVVAADSATYLTVLRDSAFVIKDTLLNNSLNFHETQVVESGSRYVSLIRLTRGSPHAAYWVNGDASGLIIVKGEKIDMIFGNKKNE